MSEENETPQPSWATWALLNEAFKPGVLVPGSVPEMCVHRLAQLAGQDPGCPVKPGPMARVVITNDGHWGRGKTLGEAAAAALKAGARRTAVAFVAIVLNDDKPEVNDGGSIVANSDSFILNVGNVGKLGGILRIQ